MSIQDLDSKFPIVNPDGTPTDYFLRMIRERGNSQKEADLTLLDKANKALNLTAGIGLDGGGDLTANRTFDLNAGIDLLNDVDTSTTPPVSNQKLGWNGSQWVPQTVSGGASRFIGEAISTGVGSTLSVTIPPGYKRLNFDFIGRGTQPSLSIRLNGDTSLIYDTVRAFWSNTGLSGTDGTNSQARTFNTISPSVGTAPAPCFLSGEILNPSDAMDKQIPWRGKQLVSASGSTYYEMFGLSAWRSTAVVNAVAIVNETTAGVAGVLGVNSILRVYGDI